MLYLQHQPYHQSYQTMLNLIHQRNADLMKAIRREIASSPYGTPIMETLSRAVEQPAPRFYVTFESALRAVSLSLAGKTPCRDIRRKRQWHDLTSLVADLLDKQPRPLTMAVARVLTTAHAPSFYISPARALSIYHEQQRISAAIRSSRPKTSGDTPQLPHRA